MSPCNRDNDDDSMLPAASVLVTSTPLRPPDSNGHDETDSQSQIHSVNGNVHVNIVSESTSMDVLSGGESDAGDTLNRRNNNSISSTLTTTTLPREGDATAVRRRGARDVTYCIADELLMTERTYKRDLELVTVTWSKQVSNLTISASGEVASSLARGCLSLGPLAIPAGKFLAKLDKCLTAAPSADSEPEYKKIGDLLYDHLASTFDAYSAYIEKAGAVVGLCESARRRSAAVDAAVSALDAQSPLPLSSLLLRPLHRLLHLERLAIELAESMQSRSALNALELARELAAAASAQLRHVENHAVLCQLQRDILGFDKLLVADREFVRLGCVYKHSSVGMQQRMLFLFTDILIIASKSGGQFRAHSVWPVRALSVSPTELPHSFTITGEDMSVLISASNEHEFAGWVHSLEMAIEDAAHSGTHGDTQLTPYEQDAGSSSPVQSGSSLTAVCWHRAASLSRDHLHLAMGTQLSGCLLRKFKNSVGWQKLWVVFAAFTLFFYKHWHDESPLASLPLLGYTVGPPSESDAINKEFVFKLQYKNHIYFFRANTQFAYNRWIEVLRTAMVRDEY